MKTNFSQATTKTNKPFYFTSERGLKQLLVELNSNYTFDSIPEEFEKGLENSNKAIKNSKAFDLAKSKKALNIFTKLVQTTVEDNEPVKAYPYLQFALTLEDNQLNYEYTKNYINFNDLYQCITELEKETKADKKLTKDDRQKVLRYFINKEVDSMLNCMIAQATIQNAFDNEKVMDYSVDTIITYKEFEKEFGQDKNPFNQNSNNAKATLCNILLNKIGITDLKLNSSIAKGFYDTLVKTTKNQDHQNIKLLSAYWQFIIACRKQYNNIVSKTIDKAKVLKTDNESK